MRVLDLLEEFIKVSSREEVLKLGSTLNCWGWHDALGPKPFDNETPLLIASGHVRPLRERIEKDFTEYELMQYHHLVNMNRTQDQFQAWWDEEQTEAGKASLKNALSLLKSVYGDLGPTTPVGHKWTLEEIAELRVPTHH